MLLRSNSGGRRSHPKGLARVLLLHGGRLASRLTATSGCCHLEWIETLVAATLIVALAARISTERGP